VLELGAKPGGGHDRIDLAVAAIAKMYAPLAELGHLAEDRDVARTNQAQRLVIEQRDAAV
jgi:hypothetical protein